VAQEAYEIFRVGCLARAAHGEVADVDDGDGEGDAFEPSGVEEFVAHVHPQAVEPTQRRQPFMGRKANDFHGTLHNKLRKGSGFCPNLQIFPRKLSRKCRFLCCAEFTRANTQVASKLRFCQNFGVGFSKKCALLRKFKYLIINISLFVEPSIRYRAETVQRPSRARESGVGCQVLCML